MMSRSLARLCVLLAGLVPAQGCSDPAPGPSRDAQRSEDFRVVKLAGEKVVVPFRPGLPMARVPEAVAGFVPGSGDRVVLSDAGDGEIFLARDLEALQFYHAEPGADQLGRFRLLGNEGRLFVVARGTSGSVQSVREGVLPQGLRAVELRLGDSDGLVAWVSESFVRKLELEPK